MIKIQITTSDGASWVETYSGTADDARTQLVGEVIEEPKPAVTIVAVERVDSPEK